MDCIDNCTRCAVDFALWNATCLPGIRSFSADRLLHQDKLVSVLIPARNERLHIEGCLESVLKQHIRLPDGSAGTE